jgi:gliding motility-associated lipoprotein GldH
LFTWLLISSCGEKPFYDETVDFDHRTWDVSDTAYFEFEITDTVTSYDLFLTLRTSTEFSYSNLWVHILSTAPDLSTSKVAQVINLAAADGAWLGRVSGTTVESRLKYSSTTFPLKGNYKIGVVQAIQKDQVYEVLDIGLRIQPQK